MGLDPQAPVSSLGEDGIVELLRARFTPSPGTVGVGDDGAVFAAPGAQLVMTTDTLVEGVDFSRDYFSGADLGWKALAVNVSDIAAMGAAPSQAVATLCMPPETPVGFVTDLIHGIGEGVDTWGIELVGGDLSSATETSLGFALLGPCDIPTLRSGAKPGDALMVSGTLGGSFGGLWLLQTDPTAAGPLVERHRRPRPRLELSRALRNVPVTSMIDVSDGMIVDLGRLMSASDTGCRVVRDSIPCDADLEAAGLTDPLRAALFGGEDFELLFTVPQDSIREVTDAGERIGVAVAHIGTVTQEGCFLDDTPFDDLEGEGWDHLRSR